MLVAGVPSYEVRSALLIDADNFHDPAQLQAIHSQFGQRVGKGFTCHVHGDHKLLFRDELKPIWQEMAARLLPCLPLSKNTTDAALIVDALLLHFKFGIRRFGIASGDADFAPLAVQLRELGCEVTCFARKAIAFEAMVPFYDHVVRFDVVPTKSADVPLASSAAPVKAPMIPVSASLKTKTNSTKAMQPASTPIPDAAVASVKPSIPTVLPSDAQKALADRILKALPPWRPHTLKQLNQLGGPLRQAGVKAGKAPLYELFRQCGPYFTVLPLTGAPKQVRLERPL